MNNLKRKDIERIERKRDIINTAMKLFAEKDFHEVKVDEIAQKVGLSKGTLYLYFKNKEDLFFSIIKDKTELLFSKLKSAIQNDAPYLERLENFINYYLSFFEEYQPYFKLIHSEKGRMDIKGQNRLRDHMIKTYYDYESVLQKFIKEGQKEGILRSIDPGAVTKALRGLLNSFTFDWIFIQAKGSLVQQTSTVLDIFLKGVKR